MSLRLSDDLLDLRLERLSCRLRFLSRRLLRFPRLRFSRFDDLFLFLRLSSLDELISDDELSVSESVSDSVLSNSLSEELSDSDV